MNYVDSNELKGCQVTDLMSGFSGVELLMMCRMFLKFICMRFGSVKWALAYLSMSSSEDIWGLLLPSRNWKWVLPFFQCLAIDKCNSINIKKIMIWKGNMHPL